MSQRHRAAEVTLPPKPELRAQAHRERHRIREEGVALRFLEINGVWEDHVRYGFTVEEWSARRDELRQRWL